MIVDHTQAALLKRKKPWYKTNPLPYLWTAWQHMVYFVAPHNDCIYCWLGRVFVIGLLIGWHVTMWWYKK